ncbi:hypothetical protein Btru_045033, partial [Bulinus truncatus]
CASIERSVYIQQTKCTLLFSPSAVGGQQSVSNCAMRCHNNNNNCSAFSFDRSTLTCTLGQGVISQQATNTASMTVYQIQNPSCDLAAGFTVETNGQTSKKTESYFIGPDDMQEEGVYRWQDDGSIIDSKYLRKTFLDVLAETNVQYTVINITIILLPPPPTTQQTNYARPRFEPSTYIKQNNYSALLKPSVAIEIESLNECAMRCHDNMENCSAFSYDKQTLNCTLGECVISQPTMAAVAIYQMEQPSCDSTAGFTVETNGHTFACLWWSNVTKNFTNAKLDCQARDSILATFKSLEKFQILQRKKEIIYIGLDDMEVEGVFRWHDDGSVLDSTYMKQIFRTGQPDYFTNDDCVQYVNGTLYDVPCGSVSKSSVVAGSVHNVWDCARSCHSNKNCSAFSYDKITFTCILGECIIPQTNMTDYSINIYQTQLPSCNLTAGFAVEQNGHTFACLWWSTEAKNFTDADKDCQAKGAILATFKTTEKFKILQKKLDRYYIGLDDMEVPGQCVISQPAMTSSSVTIYQTQQPSCDLSAGFTVERNGHTFACLWWSTEAKSYTDCLAKGSSLASFKTMETYEYEILQRKSAEYYIGLDDVETDGIYRWLDDGSDSGRSYLSQLFTP